MIKKDFQFYKFSAYGFLKNLRLFDPFIFLYFISSGLSFFEIGILYSVRETTTFLLEIPTGIIADITGRRKSLLLSFVAYIISFLVFYFYPGFSLLIIAMILFSVGDSFRTGTHKAMILDYLAQQDMLNQKTLYYGHTRSWSQKGSAVSSLLAGGLILYAGNYEVVFLASIIPYFLNLINVFSYPKNLDGVREIKFTDDDKKPFKDFIGIFRSAEFRIKVSNSAAFDGLFKALKDYLQPIIYSFALALPLLLNEPEETRSTILISLIYFFIFWLNSFASKKSATVVKRTGKISSAIDYTFLLGIIFVLFSGIFFEYGVEFLAVAFFLLLYLVQNIRRPMNISFISESVPQNILASGLSVESQMRTLAAAVLAPSIGLVADLFGVGMSVIIHSGIILCLFPLVSVKRFDK